MTKTYKKIKLTTCNSVSGYKWSNIKKFFDKKTFDFFEEFMFGRQVGSYNEEYFVYKHDFEEFTSRLKD